MTDKDDRIAKDDKSKRYKYVPKEAKEVIKAKVQELKKQRVIAQESERAEKEKHYIKNRQMMKNLHHKLLRGKGEEPIGGDIPPYQIRDNSQVYEVSKSQPVMKQSSALKQTRSPQLGNGKLPSKFTIDSLSKLRYEDIAGSGPDGFNPADILDEDDSESEDSVLKQYRNNDLKHTMNNSVVEIPIPKPNQLYQGKLNSMRNIQVDKSQEVPIGNMKASHHKRGGQNNSIADGQHNLSHKRLHQPKLGNQTNVASKQNLIHKSPAARKRGTTTDNEKLYKKKLATERPGRANLPKGVHKTAKKGENGAYQSDGQNMKYPSHVTRSVKKQSSKIVNDKNVGKSKCISFEQFRCL
jgi:hypothetical protein